MSYDEISEGLLRVGGDFFCARDNIPLSAQVEELKQLINLITPLGIIECANCKKPTPVIEEGLDHICPECEMEVMERKLAERDAEHDSLVNMLNMEIERLEQRLQVATEFNGILSSLEYSDFLAKAKEEGRKEAVPEGWQIVPKEPTPEMYEAFKFKYVVGDYWKERLQGALDAMLAAAPKPQGD